MMNCAIDGQNINTDAIVTTGSLPAGSSSLTYTSGSAGANSASSCWGYWQNYYYPQIIRESYPIYLQEKAMDKGKQAFELVKALMDKKLLNIEKVKDFVEAMDTVLKTL